MSLRRAASPDINRIRNCQGLRMILLLSVHTPIAPMGLMHDKINLYQKLYFDKALCARLLDKGDNGFKRPCFSLIAFALVERLEKNARRLTKQWLAKWKRMSK